VQEIIARSGLITYSVAGEDLMALAERLRGRPGVEQVAAFGTTLHVSGTDAPLLAQTIAGLQAPGLVWARIEPGFEDVFIALIERQEVQP
jgi:ABC-2 type transport system ATP-binding protein